MAELSKTASLRGIGVIRALVLINLALVAFQPISAGFFLSGYGLAAKAHGGVALALQLGVLVQAITAVVLWRLRRVPAWVAGLSIGLFVMVFLQVGLGYRRSFWLHVPLGVAMVVGLMRQINMLNALWRERTAVTTMR